MHVTFRVACSLATLRGPRAFRAVEAALWQGAQRFGTALVQFSVQRNHVHLIVEAPEKRALMRAVKGLSVRIARALNRVRGQRGQVIGDRYHARLLRTPTEVRRAIHYIADNGRKHLAAEGRTVDWGWVDPCSSLSPRAPKLPAPQTWLVRVGWRRVAPGASLGP